MKSTILLVLLAVCHISLAKPQDAEPVYSVGSERTYSESISSGDGSIIDNHSKIPCDCQKSKPKITYGAEQIVKGKPETYIHHQPKIIVHQPPTHVRIDHPPTIIQPSTIMFHRNGKTIRRPVIYQHLPQDVQVRPVYVKVVKPIEKKVIIEKKSKHADIINSNDDKLEYETTYGGRTYSASFDEQQQESIDIQKSKQVHAKVESGEYVDGHAYSGSYAEKQEESVGIQKSKQVHAKVESGEYDGIYGGGHSYSGSIDEQQHEAVDIEKSHAIQASQYDNLYGGRHYSESFDEHEHEAESYHGHVDVKETEEY